MFFNSKQEPPSLTTDPIAVMQSLPIKYKWLALGVGSAVLAILFMLFISGKSESPPAPVDYDPCCAYPCENDGICISNSDRTYLCDCTRTGYYGLNCSIPYWSTWFGNLFSRDPAKVHNSLTTNSWIWSILNRITFLRRWMLKNIYLSFGDMNDVSPRYEAVHPYITLNAYFDEDYYARMLPPVPDHCPTPMGIHGHKELPPVDEVIKNVFYRKTFKPEPQRTNTLFQYFSHHFSHQFLRSDKKKDPGSTYGKGGIDASHIYGVSRKSQNSLRSMTDGKLKTSIVNGEQYTPHLKDCEGLEMDYPASMNLSSRTKYGTGHPFFNILPGLFIISSLWIREHNRVCDILKTEHPHWDDDRLYHTAKLIITGEILKIGMEELVQHLSQYKIDLLFDPELVHGTRFQFHNKVYNELVHLHHWHPLVPDVINVNGTEYSIIDMFYKTDVVFEHGLNNYVKALLNTRAGAITHHNFPTPLNDMVLKKILLAMRKLRYQGINAYRKRFGLKPFKTFDEMTNDKEFAAVLEKLYGHVDAVEYYVGLLSENPGTSVIPLSMVSFWGPWTVKQLMSHPLCSPHWWKASTFGGDVGFNIVKTASLTKLFCRNLKKFDACETIAFTVPNKD